MIDYLSIACITTGLLFFVSGAIGLIRLPDIHCRLHALSKADNLGLAFVALGIMLIEADAASNFKILLIWLLVLASSAVSAQLVSSHALKKERQHD